MTIREIRELLSVSRIDFSRRYNIPVRTLENWESGKREPAEWVIELLERVVKGEIEMDERKMNEIKIVQNVWKYVSNLRKRYGTGICTDPQIDFTGEVIDYTVQPNDKIMGTMYEVRLEDGWTRHKGIGDGCFWTEWEDGSWGEEKAVEELLICYN